MITNIQKLNNKFEHYFSKLFLQNFVKYETENVKAAGNYVILVIHLDNHDFFFDKISRFS